LALEKPGGKNVFMDKINELDLPSIDQKKVRFSSVDGENKINLEDLFKTDKDDVFRGFFSYLQYDGSLSIPPCEEYVTWYVVDPAIEIGFTLL
jgi:carbonic anhydrase